MRDQHHSQRKTPLKSPLRSQPANLGRRLIHRPSSDCPGQCDLVPEPAKKNSLSVAVYPLLGWSTRDSVDLARVSGRHLFIILHEDDSILRRPPSQCSHKQRSLTIVAVLQRGHPNLPLRVVSSASAAATIVVLDRANVSVLLLLTCPLGYAIVRSY